MAATGDAAVWRRLLHPAGPLLVLALLVPWYAAVERRFPGFLYDQFINEQWGHVINRRFPLDSNRVPLAIFCLEHLVWFFPWTLFLPAAWWTVRKGARGERRAEAASSREVEHGEEPEKIRKARVGVCLAGGSG